MSKKIAIIGIQGLPSKYGGFETLAEYLVDNLCEKYEITIFCSSKIYDKNIKTYKKSKLKYLPFNPNGIQSIIYDSVAILFSILKYDKLIILGSSGGIIMPLLRKYKSKIILNFGGLDWTRSKWSYIAKIYLKLSEKYSVNNSGIVISDNKCIQDYIKQKYNIESILIEYGGDHAKKLNIHSGDENKYPFLNHKYALNVARIQSDNNVEIIIQAFIECDNNNLVVIGNWNSSDYGIGLRNKYKNYKNIYLIDAIYKQSELDRIRSNCYVYVHGHSAGGTNPALVEAMSLSLPIIAYSSGFNESTTEDQALYYKNKNDLISIINNIDVELLKENSIKMYKIAKRRYMWDVIVSKYEECLNN